MLISKIYVTFFLHLLEELFDKMYRMTQKFVVTCEHSSNFVMIFTCIVYVVFVFNILLCTCITVSISILSCQMTFARACKSTNKIQNNTRQPLAILSVIAYS